MGRVIMCPNCNVFKVMFDWLTPKRVFDLSPQQIGDVSSGLVVYGDFMFQTKGRRVKPRDIALSGSEDHLAQYTPVLRLDHRTRLPV